MDEPGVTACDWKAGSFVSGRTQISTRGVLVGLRCWLPSRARSWQARLNLDPQQVQTLAFDGRSELEGLERSFPTGAPEGRGGTGIVGLQALSSLLSIPLFSLKGNHIGLHMIIEKEIQTMYGRGISAPGSHSLDATIVNVGLMFQFPRPLALPPGFLPGFLPVLGAISVASQEIPILA